MGERRHTAGPVDDLDNLAEAILLDRRVARCAALEEPIERLGQIGNHPLVHENTREMRAAEVPVGDAPHVLEADFDPQLLPTTANHLLHPPDPRGLHLCEK